MAKVIIMARSRSNGRGIRSRLAWCGMSIWARVGCRCMGIEVLREEATTSWALSCVVIDLKNGDMYEVLHCASLLRSKPRQRALLRTASQMVSLVVWRVFASGSAPRITNVLVQASVSSNPEAVPNWQPETGTFSDFWDSGGLLGHELDKGRGAISLTPSLRGAALFLRSLCLSPGHS